jgi:hypothetical protein
VAGVATNATDDVGGEVALLGAVILAVSDLTTYNIISNHEKEAIRCRELTVLASLVLVVAESTVEGGQLTKLVALEFVLTLRDGCGLEYSQ